MANQLLALPIFVNPPLSLFHSVPPCPLLQRNATECVCLFVCVRMFVWPAGTFAVTQTEVMNPGLTCLIPHRSPHNFVTSFRMWCSLYGACVCTHTKAVDTQGHEHAQTRTCTRHTGSPAFNPSPLVSGGSLCARSLPFVLITLNMRRTSMQGPVLWEETCMRGMRGQWEQEIDWERTHWDKVRQQHKASGLQGHRTMWTQRNGSSRSQSRLIVCKWIKHCGGQRTYTSAATSLIFWIKWNWGQPTWSISINLIIYDHKVAQVTSALTQPVNSSSIAFTLSENVRCIKENKIQKAQTQFLQTAFPFLSQQRQCSLTCCSNQIHYREQICLRLSLAWGYVS